MKICVVSDSHGDTAILEKIYNANPNCNIYLHLGDSLLDEHNLHQFNSVKGNCDYFSDFPLYRIISTSFGNIYAEHGHIHGRGSINLLKKHNCKVYLYGHTHIHRIEEMDGYYFVNPGSCSLPRDGTAGTYLIIDFNNDKINFEFKEI